MYTFLRIPLYSVYIFVFIALLSNNSIFHHFSPFLRPRSQRSSDALMLNEAIGCTFPLDKNRQYNETIVDTRIITFVCI